MKEQEELQRIARRDIQSALVGLSTTEKQLNFIKLEEVANKAVYEAYQQQLITGRRSPLDVFVVLNNYNQSKLKAIDTEYKMISEQYEVVASFGKLNELLGL